MALLEADVALPVVRDFIARVKDKALGQEVVGSLNPGQALVGIVHQELARTMGEGVADLDLATQPPAVILMAGLQGAGKTTTTAKLAKHLIEQAQEEGADGLGRRLPAGRHRAAEDGDAAGRRRVVRLDAGPDAARHCAGRARPRQAPLFRRAAGRHRRPAGDRRGVDGRDPRPACGAEAGRDPVRRRRDAGPGRGQHRQGLQGGACR